MTAINLLSARRVETLRKPGKYFDGDGLFLHVRSDTSRSWFFRYRSTKKKKVNGGYQTITIGLGSIRDVSLSQAREMRAELRGLIARGIEPQSPKRLAQTERMSSVSFRDIAERYINQHEHAGAWSEKHLKQWRITLQTHVYPFMGDMSIEAVDKAIIVKALDAIWVEIPETARRVRGRIKVVLDWAIDRGYRGASNPTPTPRGMGPQPDDSRNMPALPWQQLPQFMAELRLRNGIAARALEYIILNCNRTKEVRLMRWSTNEIDLDNRKWTIPADRMKGRREHVVPLTDRSIEIIQFMQDKSFNDWVFPGERSAAMGEMTISSVIRRMNAEREADGLRLWVDPKQDDVPIVPHGFRSSFKSWSSATQPFPREVSEACLAHIEPDRTVRAYDRDDLFIKRSLLLNAWANYCTKSPDTAKVLDFDRRAAE